jgi:hypothetical protein
VPGCLSLWLQALAVPVLTYSFGLANGLGYASKISNTVVDAIGDMSGGVRLYNRQDNHS